MVNYYGYFSLFLLLTAVALTTTTTHNHTQSRHRRHFTAARSQSPPIAPPLPISPLPFPVPPQTTSPPLPLPSPPPVHVLSPPTVRRRSPPPPPLPPENTQQQQQFKNIIDALIGAGDFTGWANIIFNSNPNSSITKNTVPVIPTSATLFVPGNDALSHLSTTATGAFTFDPLIIPYHILQQRLTFSELQLLKTQTRLPTLLPSKTVLITNNTPSNFTIDDSLITHPDIYHTPALCIHGIATLLDYNTYGDDHSDSLIPPPANPVDTIQMLPPAEVDDVTTSGSAELWFSGAGFLNLWSFTCLLLTVFDR